MSYFAGRFNWLSFKPNLFNVLFVPYECSASCIVARDLSKETATQLVDDLNAAMHVARYGDNTHEETKEV